jgi:hypothetical protein
MPLWKIDARDNCFWCGLSVYVWIALLATGLFLQTGCGVDTAAPPLPRVMPCIAFEALWRAHDADLEVPSMQPAPFGVRIIVDASFDPFEGSSVPVPGGRMVWKNWVWHWFDDDHLGAIGRVPDQQAVGPVPIGGVCRWYDPL